MAIFCYVFWCIAALTFIVATPLDKELGLQLGILVFNVIVSAFTIFAFFIQVGESLHYHTSSMNLYTVAHYENTLFQRNVLYRRDKTRNHKNGWLMTKIWS